jgi:hypothetical protein
MFQKSPLPLFSKEGLELNGENSPFEKRGTKGDLKSSSANVIVESLNECPRRQNETFS